jgi:hypothetical protein
MNDYRFLESFTDYGDATGFALEVPQLLDERNLFHKLTIILTKYELKLSDVSSNEYIFISYLNEAKEENYDLLKKAIEVLYIDDYIDDFFNYLLSNKTAISFTNISDFLNRRRNLQLLKLKELFATRDYKNNGNFFMYIYQNIQGSLLNNPFFANSLENLNYRSYLVKPNIDYVKSNAYRNYPQAEKDYWNIVKEYALVNNFTYEISDTVYGMGFFNGTNILNFEDYFKYDTTKNILALLFNKNYKGLIYGEPLLIQKDKAKISFTDSRSDNLTIIKILTQDYLNIYRDTFVTQLDQMYEELLDYKLLYDFEWDETKTISGSQKDFLNSFFDDKIVELSSGTLDDFNWVDLEPVVSGAQNPETVLVGDYFYNTDDEKLYIGTEDSPNNIWVEETTIDKGENFPVNSDENDIFFKTDVSKLYQYTNLFKVDIDVLKQIKFYRISLGSFLGKNSNYEAYNDEILFTAELNIVRNHFINILNYIKQNGYFE